MSVCFIFCPWQWLRILPCFFRDYSDSTIYLPTKDLSWLLFPPWSTHCRYRLLILCVTKLDCLVWRICSLTVTAPFFTSFMIMMLHYYHRMTWSKVLQVSWQSVFCTLCILVWFNLIVGMSKDPVTQLWQYYDIIIVVIIM